jgi:malonyl-CoA O-methyltransferase
MSDAPPRDAIRSGYDRWALVYDHDANPLIALEEPVVRAAIGDVRGMAVLDLGCGTGRHTTWLVARGAAVTAVDFSEGTLLLEHLADLHAFFRETRRMLRNGGRAVVSAMHPAMFLRGSQARFTDPASQQVVQPGSVAHQLGDFVMAAIGAGFRIDAISEHAPDARLAGRCPRAEKYIGWPMLVVLSLGT